MKKNYLLFLCFLFIIFFACSVFAAECKKNIISNIRLICDLQICDKEIGEIITTKTGKQFSERELQRSKNLLLATGLFDKVEVKTLFIDDCKVGIEYYLNKRKRISEIEIEGNFFILSSNILKNMRMKVDDDYKKEMLEEAKADILNFYKEKGYFETTVDVEVKENIKAGLVKIIFYIKEGKTATVRKIEFEGNHSIDNQRLLALIKTKKIGFYSPTKLEEDLNRLKNFYLRKGYFDVKIKYTVNLETKYITPALSIKEPLKTLETFIPREGLAVNINFKIEEGEQYLVKIVGNQKVKESTIRKLLTFFKGGFF